MTDPFRDGACLGADDAAIRFWHHERQCVDGRKRKDEC